MILCISLFWAAQPSLGASSDDAKVQTSTQNVSKKQWGAEQSLLIEMNRQVALTLKRDGFEAYSALFHPEYSNWFMGVLPVRDRAVFLRDIKKSGLMLGTMQLRATSNLSQSISTVTPRIYGLSRLNILQMPRELHLASHFMVCI